MEDLIKGELDWHNKVNENFHEVDSQMADIVTLNIKQLPPPMARAIGNANYIKEDGTWWEDEDFTVPAIDDTQAFKNAISYMQNGTFIVPKANYLLTDMIDFNKPNVNWKLCNSTFNFKLPDNIDGIHFTPGNNRSTLENVTIDLHGTGRDGFVMTGGDRCDLDNIVSQNTKRNGFSFYSQGYEWIENLHAKHLASYKVGLHGFYLYVGTGSAFINDCIFEQCELRACSLLNNGGSAVCAEIAGSQGGNKMSSLHWLDCNFDEMRALSQANGFDTSPNPMVLKYTEGASNIYENWTVLGGAWEDMSFHNDARKTGLIYGESGVHAYGWFVTGIINGGWSASSTNSSTFNVSGLIFNQNLNRLTVPDIVNPLKFYDTITLSKKPMIPIKYFNSGAFTPPSGNSTTQDIIIPFNDFTITGHNYSAIIKLELLNVVYNMNVDNTYYCNYETKIIISKINWSTNKSLINTPIINKMGDIIFTVNSITIDSDQNLKVNITTGDNWGGVQGNPTISWFIDTLFQYS